MVDRTRTCPRCCRVLHVSARMWGEGPDPVLDAFGDRIPHHHCPHGQRCRPSGPLEPDVAAAMALGEIRTDQMVERVECPRCDVIASAAARAALVQAPCVFCQGDPLAGPDPCPACGGMGGPAVARPGRLSADERALLEDIVREVQSASVWTLAAPAQRRRRAG